MESKAPHVAIIGSGMAGMASAVILAQAGIKTTILESNYIPGGCSTTYARKGYHFESGATTLVGLAESQPLHYLNKTADINVPAWQLSLPMEVYLADGTKISRFQDLDQWIAEASRVFGSAGQKGFWQLCQKIATQVWRTSTQQLYFPFGNLSDVLQSIKAANLKQASIIPYAFISIDQLLRKFNLHQNQPFVDFINQQLIITAQNKATEVNVLFGATALCYTNQPNYYMPGGMLSVINTYLEYVVANRGNFMPRHQVTTIAANPDGFNITTKHKAESQTHTFSHVISAIPINNLQTIWEGSGNKPLKTAYTLPSVKLASAFQINLGIDFTKMQRPTTLHHQILIDGGIPQTESASVFLSFSHPDDTSRADLPGHGVASITTHIHNPEKNIITDKHALSNSILAYLNSLNLIPTIAITYQHTSTTEDWLKWTGRAFGFVGGYPQIMATKPWNLNQARLYENSFYGAGDTFYPGQGIPGAALSGIIAAKKLIADNHF